MTQVVRVAVSASVELPAHTPAQVWAFVKPAESVVLLNADAVRGFTVPGTGPGVGEQRVAVVMKDGQEVFLVSTVTAEEPGRFTEATVKLPVSDGFVDSGGRYDVEAAGQGSVFTTSWWMDVWVGAPHKVIRQQEASLQDQVRKHVERVKMLLEAGVVPRARQS